jgi:hypothetical protein
MIRCVVRGVSRMMSVVLQLVICVTLSSVFLFVIVYETEPINNRIVRIHHEFRFRSSTAAVRTEDEHIPVYMPRCADLHPRPSSRYAVLVEKIGDGHGYFLSALKLGVRLNWYLHALRNNTDLIMEIVQASPPRSTPFGRLRPQVTPRDDVAVRSALQAGYDHVCHARAMVGGPYTRFVVFNMTQYESVLYIDGITGCSHFTTVSVTRPAYGPLSENTHFHLYLQPIFCVTFCRTF